MTGRILITGAKGFIGQYCLEAFAKAGWETIACLRLSADLPYATDILECDLLDHVQTERVVSNSGATHLLHLAWHSDGPTKWTSATNMDWVDASLNLARAFAAQNGKHFLFAGSCAEYDWAQSPFHAETTPVRPATPYGEAKAKTGAALAALQSTLDLKVAHARLFFCYGHGEPKGRLLPDLIDHIQSGTPFDCSDGLQRRDYLYAADIAEACLTIASAAASGVINIGSGTAVPVRDLVQAAADLLGRPDIPQYGAIPQRDGDPEEIEADISGLSALGFTPRFDLVSGVRDTIARREGAG